MNAPEPIDLRFGGRERVIAVYVLETGDGPALFDCGPSTTIDALLDGLAGRGLALEDIRHLLLSHIHLDHAGAAGMLTRAHPGLQVHVSPIGVPHLVDPARLEASARRLYGDSFDELWGELAPVPQENIRPTGPRVLDLECFPTPGHASHHVSFLDAEGVLYAGDAVGVRVVPGSYVLPAAPPPDIDLEDWEETFRAIESREPACLALTHFGVATDVAAHVARMREELQRWADWVAEGVSQDEFVARGRRALFDADGVVEGEASERAAPFWQSYLGLKRYWDNRRREEIERAGATA
jgi:glyoxylase-like metal-dependent hydrolase (beta-lactamase superfamily II)